MLMNPSARLLVLNGAVQIAFSIAIGFLMLVPLQSWGRPVARFLPKQRDLGSAHLDWLMLALTEFAAAVGVQHLPSGRSTIAASLLVIGTWLNPLPYVLRGYGIDAFVLAGRPTQIMGALVGLGSSVALATGWAMLIIRWMSGPA
jgi:hypothetical protein